MMAFDMVLPFLGSSSADARRRPHLEGDPTVPPCRAPPRVENERLGVAQLGYAVSHLYGQRRGQTPSDSKSQSGLFLG